MLARRPVGLGAKLAKAAGLLAVLVAAVALGWAPAAGTPARLAALFENADPEVRRAAVQASSNAAGNGCSGANRYSTASVRMPAALPASLTSRR